MSKQEIANWTQRVEDEREPDGDGAQDEYDWTRLDDDWDGFMLFAKRRILSSSTKTRITFINGRLVPLALRGDLDMRKTMDVFKLVVLTLPRYVDAPSREAVGHLAEALVRRDELRGKEDGESEASKMGVAEQIIGWLNVEATRMAKAEGAVAATQVSVLLSWTCSLYTLILPLNKHFIRTPIWKQLVVTFALLLDYLLDPRVDVKPTLRKGATVHSRRAVRSSPDAIPELVETLAQWIPNSPPNQKGIPLLGLAYDVSAHLRNVETKEAIVSRLKEPILRIYISVVLSSKVLLSDHVAMAFNAFIGHNLQEEDHLNQVLPVVEKMLLRSPEICLPTVVKFYSSYKAPIPSEELKRVLSPTLNAAKSTNPVVRSGSTSLFGALFLRPTPESDLKAVVELVLALPLTGKSTGPDHRQALYSMLKSVKPGPNVSPYLSEVLVPLMEKETNDGALGAIAEALPKHIANILKESKSLSPTTTSIMVKELGSPKAHSKRALLSLMGQVFWQISREQNGEQIQHLDSLFSALRPALEKGIKEASTTVSNTSSAVDAWIAVLIFLISSQLKQTNADLKQTPSLYDVVIPRGKPSFLYTEKVYQKVTTETESIWLLRTLDSVVSSLSNELSQNSRVSLYLGQALLWLAVDHPSPALRREVLSSLKRMSSTFPNVTSTSINLALNQSLFESQRGAEETSPHRSSRLSAVLTNSTNFENQPLDLKEELLLDLLLVSHHSDLYHSGENLWIELIQQAGIDPHHLITRNLETLVASIDNALATNESDSPLRAAALRAVTTVTFIVPEKAVPAFVRGIQERLKAENFSPLGTYEYGVWATPSGVTFVDVLSSKKGPAAPEKGKEANIKKWEDELRKSIAQKRADPALSKQDKVLVDAQLAKEEATRTQLRTLQRRALDGLIMIQNLLKSHTDESRSESPALGSLLMDGPIKTPAAFVGEPAVLTYIDLYNFASDRLESYRKWIGIAALRTLQVGNIPEELTAESLDSLIGRLLYKIRALSEQVPFEAPTFSLIWALLQAIVSIGGVAATSEDDAIEQLVLVLDIIRSHSTQLFDSAYPRKSICSALVILIAHHPKVSRDAISTLLEVGEAMSASASVEEQDFLVASTLSQEVFVRNACLQAMQSFDFTEREWIPPIWVACHDEDDQNSNLARRLWTENGLDIPEAFLPHLIGFLGHHNSYVRKSCARSLKECLEIWPSSITATIQSLKDLYREKAKVLVPEYDAFGMVIASTLDRPDPWETRLAIADTFYQMAPLLHDEDIVPFFDFLIQHEAIGDRRSDVRRRMLEAGSLIIQIHGKNQVAGLISIFEGYLGQKSLGSESEDHIRQAVVILLGSLARHLQKSDSRIKEVVYRLVEALKTPSEVVQESVADCLSPLASLIEDDIGGLIDQLYGELTSSPKYAARRGAAYGIAGLIRGTGIAGIQRYSIIRRLRDAAADKKSYEARQGASFALEMLARILGRGFEPYIVQLLPMILTAFGDANPEVREATIDASKVIMAKLSGYGVKQIMPKVMEGLEEKQWRTKKGSVELLGSMAFCAPKQLSSALPTIVPQLTVVLTDSHAQVRTAGNKSLKQFGEVISNPEIHSLVSTLLKALVDPEKTPVALNALLKKSFVHYIDSPSLAIVIPIIERGLRERSADTKRKATQIVGQMASLTDSKDFIPYLPHLLPLVHVVLVDPVPEARATAAKALGTLVERLGEGQFPDLVQNLLKTLRSDTSGVDRQGAAQGLSEVLSGLGMERLEGLLPDIISSASSPRSYVREGFMSLLVYLPATFGARFQPHLPKIIPPILRGLADIEEYVREASMKAGRMIIVNYSSKAVDLLLPELEQGIFDPGWRIRQSSITLIGELLFRLSGISGKAELEEEEEADAAVAESSRKVLIEALGQERRDRVLGALYLVRQDAIAAVRMASVHIWKALVSNTPRTVREILPTLINQIIDLLSMPNGDQRETSARTVGELCRKFGERILGDILPILQRGSKHPDARIREGVCLAVSEIIENSTETQREQHEDEMISIVRRSLVDNAANVRAAAAAAFDVLQDVVGARAIDETIPTLLEALRQPGESSGTALQALREVMTVRASTVFPVLIPTLISTPMTSFNARALASLVTVAGSALSKRLTIILTALIRAVENETNEELKSDINEAVSALLGSISDPEGLQTLMLLLAGWVKNESWKRRVSAINFFETFCIVTNIDFSLYRPDWVRNLVTMMDDRQAEVVQAAVSAFEAFIKSIDKDDLDTVVVTLRRTIEGCGSPGRTVPGFNIKGSVSSMLPVIIAGLTTGSNDQREQAAYAIGDLVIKTEEAAIKPYVVQFTGPLIRVATQATAYPPGVKVAILKSLTEMLDRIPIHVKPFFPQLTRTFVKSCSDASLAVRNAAARALGSLTKSSQTRIDALLTELVTSAQTSEDPAVSASMVLAIAYIIRSAHASVGPSVKETCISLVEAAFKERHDEIYLQAVAKVFTSLESSPELLRPILQSRILQASVPSVLSSLIILNTVEDAPKLFYTLECVPAILRKVVESIGEPVPGISRPAREAKELIKSTPPYCDDDVVQATFGS